MISSPNLQVLFLSFILPDCPSHPHCLAQSRPLRIKMESNMAVTLKSARTFDHLLKNDQPLAALAAILASNTVILSS